MRIPGWCGVYEAVAYRNPAGSSQEARVLMEAVHGGFEIAQVRTLEDARIIADALNLYSQVAALVQDQEREDEARVAERSVIQLGQGGRLQE